ncbi:MAG: hypothetical protein GX849_05530 [Clostridiaceae bacterium]|nr:hypothetical protein [Clostridiaceae bacterium]
MKPPILMQTDFSRNSSAVAAMLGVCQSVDPEVNIFDGNHAIPPFNVFVASTNLAYLADFWPMGTVFVSVVDPGVGTSRRGSVALLKNGQYVVTPDNGTLTHLQRTVGVQAIREIDMTVNRWPTTETCNIFHGRDVFAYTAIRLASGIIDFEGVGPAYPLEEMVIIDYDEALYQAEKDAFTGVIHSAHPHFGLVCSNIPASEVKGRWELNYGDLLEVTVTRGSQVIFQETLPFQHSFGYVDIGQPLLFISSSLEMELAMRNDNIVEKYGIEAGPEWRMQIKRA